MQPLFTFRFVPIISELMTERGHDPAELLAQAGLPSQQSGAITAPLDRVQKFVDLVARRWDGPLFGLDLAELLPAGTYGVLEFLLRSAPTMERALRALCEFAVVVNPVFDFRFTTDAREGHLRFSIAAQRDGLGCHLNEYTISFLLRQAANVFEAPVIPSRTWFAHGRPEHADAVAARLRCNVAFQAADCGFSIPLAELARSPRTADGPLFEFMLGQARAQLEQLEQAGGGDVVSQIARVIEASLPDEVSGAEIARKLGTSLRTLQRQLTATGTTFRDVLTHVRLRRRADLVRAGFSEPEIARRLGFADRTAMERSLGTRSD